MLPFCSEVFCYICERKRPELLGRQHRNSTGTGQRRGFVLPLLHPNQCHALLQQLSAEHLQVLLRGSCPRVRVCAELGEADVDVGGKSPLQNSGRLGEREASNCSNTGLEAEQAKKGSFSFFHPFPPPKGHQLEPDPAGSPSHDFMLFFLSALAAPFFSYILISYPVSCMNKRCHILP